VSSYWARAAQQALKQTRAYWSAHRVVTTLAGPVITASLLASRAGWHAWSSIVPYAAVSVVGFLAALALVFLVSLSQAPAQLERESDDRHEREIQRLGTAKPPSKRPRLVLDVQRESHSSWVTKAPGFYLQNIGDLDAFGVSLQTEWPDDIGIDWKPIPRVQTNFPPIGVDFSVADADRQKDCVPSMWPQATFASIAKRLGVQCLRVQCLITYSDYDSERYQARFIIQYDARTKALHCELVH
jgi:hypothetical protein